MPNNNNRAIGSSAHILGQCVAIVLLCIKILFIGPFHGKKSRRKITYLPGKIFDVMVHKNIVVLRIFWPGRISIMESAEKAQEAHSRIVCWASLMEAYMLRIRNEYYK